MGFLKKIFKPVSKVLDKIVPNEIKPALPYLSAFAPMMLGGGIMGTSMLQRGLMSGGLNLASQLAQEGNEGDANLLSVLMSGGIGALTSPDAVGKIQQLRGADQAQEFASAAGEVGTSGWVDKGLGYLEKGAEYLDPNKAGSLTDIIRKGGVAPGLNMETAAALGIPLTQGTMDTAYNQAKLLERDWERDQESDDGGDEDSNRALAIRQSMEAYGFTEQEILDAIAAAGYKAGGRVGFEFGGITDAVEAVEETPKEFLVDKLKVTVQPGQSEEMGILNAMFNDTDGVMSDDRKMEFYKLYIPQLYRRGEISEEVYEGMKEDIFGEGKAEGGGSGMMGIAGPEVVSKMGDEIEKGVSSLTDLITDSEGNVYTVLQYIRKFGEDAFFGGQKNPELPEKFYNKLSDEYIEEMKKVKERGYKDGGMMSVLPRNKEMDYRGGGMIPMGSKERADDVPARLSKNEFVMTADAVRAAGGGSVNEGARRMYNLMNNLEARA